MSSFVAGIVILLLCPITRQTTLDALAWAVGMMLAVGAAAGMIAVGMIVYFTVTGP